MHRILSSVVAVLFTLGSSVIVYAQDDTPPVKTLKELYKTNSEFRQTVDLAFAGVQAMPDGTPNPWQGKTIEDLYSFFNEWYYFLPNTEDGLDRIMHFAMLYYQNPHGLKLVREEPGLSWTHHFVAERAKYMESASSLSGLDEWLTDPDIYNDESVTPEGGFASFNDYFVRDLKPGVRPVARPTDNAVVVSPSDCVLNMINNDLTAETEIPLKGRMTLNLDALLAGSSYAGQFIGGTAMACFLLPDSYHHYHAPVTGTVVASQQDVDGIYFGMPDLPAMVNRGNPGYDQDFSVFEQFRRGYFIIKTPEFGYVAMVPVGLSTIGSVIFEEQFRDVKPDHPVQLLKGDRMGRFQYGGSLVILIFEPNRLSAVKTQMGQQIGVMNKPNDSKSH